MPDRLTPPLWLCVALLLIVFTILLSWTFGGWADPIVDFGRELYVPWQLTQGKVLYRDIAYFNGPLSPYLNALAFRIGGSSLRTLAVTNLALLAGLTAMLFALLSRAFSRWAALAGCIGQLTIFSFIQLAGVGNYNFVTPYSHEMTHGLILSVAMLLILTSRHSSSPVRGGEVTRALSPRRDAVMHGFAGFLLGLIFLTKIEIFLAAAVAASATLLLSLWKLDAAHSLAKRIVRQPAPFVIAFCLPPLIAFATLCLAMPTAEAFDGVLGSFGYAWNPAVTANAFYRHILGVDHTAANAAHVLAMFGISVIVLTCTTIPAFLKNQRAQTVAVVLLWLAAVVAYAAIDPQVWQTAFAGLPLLLAVILVAQIFAFRRRPDPRRLAAVAFTLFSEMLLGKMLLNIRLAQYGFVLALPALLATLGFCFDDLPRWFARGGPVRPAAIAGFVPLTALVIAVHLRPFATIFAAKPLPVGTGADRFWTADVPRPGRSSSTGLSDPRGRAVNLCLSQLAALPPNATIAVVPEGVMISYLAKRVNPTKYINLMPPEVAMFGQDAILRDFQAHPPDYIVFNDGSNPADYGYASFAEYATPLSGWVAANYAATNNTTLPSYPLRLLRRR